MRNKHGVEVAVGLWVTTATRFGVVQSIESKQGMRQALFFEDGTTELVNNVTLSEEFEIKFSSGRWEVSFPWQLQHLDKDFGGVMEAKNYLKGMHPYAKPKLAAAARPPPQRPAPPPRSGTTDWDEFDDFPF